MCVCVRLCNLIRHRPVPGRQLVLLRLLASADAVRGLEVMAIEHDLFS